ncbi:hypothetical protein [Paraburkholderia sp. ZP32-5]|uniref:hypothetical protein n=1 Tax=Paraburkholderia sp. ZP32-5 TaxID=2883245 RepID=UPI001F42FD27|nr:hypothetical protein [Paraburkholderia sp. ZP32-5]
MNEEVTYVFEYTTGFGTYRTTGKSAAQYLPLVGDNVTMKIDDLGFDGVLRVKSRLFEYDKTGLVTIRLGLSHTIA